MIGLDTNVLVRYIMQDDPKQSPKATRLIESLTKDQPGFVPLVAVVELVWVLSSSYLLNRNEAAEALDLLLRSKEIVIDRAELVLQAQRRFAQGGADFADCLIERIAHAQGCDTTMTFDAGAVKAAGMTLVV
jgi:predicted nucleic-acid-binding protein